MKNLSAGSPASIKLEGNQLRGHPKSPQHNKPEGASSKTLQQQESFPPEAGVLLLVHTKVALKFTLEYNKLEIRQVLLCTAGLSQPLVARHPSLGRAPPHLAQSLPTLQDKKVQPPTAPNC